jgi:hypothetical protein
MNPVIMWALAAFAGLAVRGIAIAELFMRLRWRGRQQRAHRAYLMALARTLPRGCWLNEVRADGSELHLVITHLAGPTEGAPR